MKKALTLTLLLFTLLTAGAQQKQIDTARMSLIKAKSDTEKYIALFRISGLYARNRPDSALIFAQQAFLLAQKNNWAADQSNSLSNIANDYINIGDYVKGTQNLLRVRKIDEGLHNLGWVASDNADIGFGYYEQHDFKQALAYTITAKMQLDTFALTHKLEAKHRRSYARIFDNIGGLYFLLHRIDSAEKYLKISYELSKRYKFDDLLGDIQDYLGKVEAARGKNAEAARFYRQALASELLIDDTQDMCTAYLDMSDLYHKGKRQDSAEYYAKKALETAQSGHFEQAALEAGKVLSTYYDEDHNLPEAYKYFKLATAAKDSMYSQDKVKQLLSLDFDEKMRQQEIAEAEIHYREKVRLYILIAGMALLVLLAFIFWRANKARTKAYNLLHKQKEEIDLQKTKVEHTLGELKATQTQLVQREKMASLGELTAGIAHEIQNPLNFVNNFSEVNQEMIDELKEELKNGNLEGAITIADDIRQNEQKINHHGKRADFIVKGMLLHSRNTTGEKEPTDINAMANEFFKLSYHGLRAKDKNFNAELITNFDPELPKVNVAHQDIGRVLLNLFNNAFYAVNEKQKTAGDDYKPEVTVTTYADKNSLVILVKDNGNGIPDAIKEKIMQPFFTTKPTGEGTGLGLSLSYDIVVKGHGGTIQVNSVEGEGSEFIIQLPIN